MRKYFLIFIALIHLEIFSQIKQDTVFLKQVNVVETNNIENLSLKVFKVDSLQLIESVNSDLGMLLTEYTPVFVKSEGRGALATVSFRGTATSHTNVLWNGISLQSPMLGQVDFSTIPAYLSDNIELFAGPSSIKTTSGALGGSINLENKPDWNNKFSVKFIQNIGSFSTFGDFLQFKIGNKKLQTNTKFLYNYSKNDFTFTNKNIADIDFQTGNYIYPVQKNNNAKYENFSLLQDYYVRISNNKSISLKYWYQNYQRSLPRLNTFEGDDYSNINIESNRNFKAVVAYQYFKNKFNIDVNSAFSFENLGYMFQNYVSGLGYFFISNSLNTSKSIYNNIDCSYKLSKTTNMEISYNFNYYNVSSIEYVKNEGYKAKRLEHLFFVMLNKQISNKISTTFILRKNFIDEKTVPFIPFFGLEYIVSQKNKLSLNSTLSKNYKSPSLNDLYWQPGGNANLKPEDAVSADFSVKYEPEFKKIDLKTNLTYFYNNVKNWIIWLPSVKGYWEPFNIQNVVSSGVELSVKIKLKLNNFLVNIGGNYSYTKSLNYGDTAIWGAEAYGKQLIYIPVHSGNFFADLRFKKYFLGYLNNSYSERYTSYSNSLSKRDWLYPYYMNNMYFGKDFNFRKFTFSSEFKIYNLFNEEYRSVLGRPMPKRNYLLTISLKF